MAIALSSFTGNAIYVDTMIPYMLLRGIAEAQPFFECLERGEVLAYTSVLTFDELGYRLILALIKDITRVLLSNSYAIKKRKC